MPRSATIDRTTGETKISLSITLDGNGSGSRTTGIGFLDHMLDLFARHGMLNLNVEAEGDLHVDAHHTTEDVGICLGQAIDQALGDRAGIQRYGHFTLPMDETLVTSAIDLGGRFAFEYNAPIGTEKIGDFDTELVEHFWHSFAVNARCNLHVLMHYGNNSHHISEGVFKATARALRMATTIDSQIDGVMSTKGVL